MNLRISELSELSSLGDDDFLILQRNEGNDKKSYKIAFSDFKKQFIETFNSKYVKSAGQCNESQFAPFAHGHDYSDVWYFPSYGPASKNSNPENRSSLCCICNGTLDVVKYGPGVGTSEISQLSVWSPRVRTGVKNELAVYSQYKIGDLQFLAVKDLFHYLSAYRGYKITNGNIDINSQSFDGFVIPNGQQIKCSSNTFKGACKAYAGNQYATSFKLPDLTNTFFACDPGLPQTTMKALSVIPFNNAIPEHNHGGQITQFSDNVEFKLTNIGFSVRQTNTTSNAMSYPQCVAGGGNAKSQIQSVPVGGYVNNDSVCPKITKADIKCSVTSMKCNETGEDQESFPDYCGIQALLYIGLSNE